MSSLRNLIFITCLISAPVISDTPVVNTKTQATAVVIAPGYSALKLFLEDEQHLTTIRRAKMVITFKNISDKTKKLIDEIADTSEIAIEELELLATEKPAFTFEAFSDESIGKTTLDSIRMTTAKEFLVNDDNFEKDLLVSQLNVLRVISHLARQIEEKESNNKRKTWLNKLADNYENYYQQANARIVIAD